MSYQPFWECAKSTVKFQVLPVSLQILRVCRQEGQPGQALPLLGLFLSISSKIKNWGDGLVLLDITVTTSPAAAAAKSLQSCPTLCDPTDGSPPGSPVPGMLQARTLEWVAISFSNAWKWKVKVKSLSRVQLFATPWTVAYQAPLSMGFSGRSTGVGCHCLLRTTSPRNAQIVGDTKHEDKEALRGTLWSNTLSAIPSYSQVNSEWAGPSVSWKLIYILWVPPEDQWAEQVEGPSNAKLRLPLSEAEMLLSWYFS